MKLLLRALSTKTTLWWVGLRIHPSTQRQGMPHRPRALADMDLRFRVGESIVRSVQKCVLDMRMGLILFQGTEITCICDPRNSQRLVSAFCTPWGMELCWGPKTGTCALVFGNGGVGSWILRNHDKVSLTSISDKNSCIHHWTDGLWTSEKHKFVKNKLLSQTHLFFSWHFYTDRSRRRHGRSRIDFSRTPGKTSHVPSWSNGLKMTANLVSGFREDSDEDRRSWLLLY